jgi:peptidoglycan/xylan/chitin deacetylase (PgdA/CDA1 family)
VPPSDFAAQLAYLAEHGYRTIGLEEVAGYLAGERRDPPPPRSVVLTFDDGYRDNYEAAYPLLKKHGFRATIFMVSGFVDRPGYLTWAQLREMAASGITIGGHTLSHPDLTRLKPVDVMREVAESKAILEHGIGRPVHFFAYPSGRYNQQVVEALKAAGYQGAVTVNHSLRHDLTDRFTLGRVRVSGGQRVASVMASAGLTADAVAKQTSLPVLIASPRSGPAAE